MLVGFHSVADAAGTVSDIIAVGILPTAVEMMDALAIEAAEAAARCGYPGGPAAVLVVEPDGPQAEVNEQFRQAGQLAGAHAFETRTARHSVERALMWKGRKPAFAAVGRISPAYYVQDGVIPRTKLPEVLTEIGRLANEAGIRVANVFHAGDGNLHPHGVGIEKQSRMTRQFTDDDLDTMHLLRCAFDPEEIADPGKQFPTPRLCGERPGVRTAADAYDPARWARCSEVAAPKGAPAAVTVAGVEPAQVVTPATAPEVADLLRSTTGTVVPVGAGTKTSWAAPPTSCDLLLRTTGLDGITEHAPGDLVVVAEAGVRLAALQRQLAAHGQMPAPDPAEPGATLGGIVSANTSGPRRLRYGTARDLLIGVTVVLADGTTAKAGGKVVKNFAGYDLGKLYSGAHGGDCVHCGFCLPTCPTYVLWGQEMDSPRGPIDLMKGGLEGNAFNASSVRHLDQCLGCMSCRSRPPSPIWAGGCPSRTPCRYWTRRSAASPSPCCSRGCSTARAPSPPRQPRPPWSRTPVARTSVAWTPPLRYRRKRVHPCCSPPISRTTTR
jgi:FAD/FMN-containing dehydrogenase